MPGLNDFLAVQEGTNDSMMNYDIDQPIVSALEDRLPFQGRQMNQQAGLGMKDDALNVPIETPDAFGIDPFEFQGFDTQMETPNIETRIEELQLDEGGLLSNPFAQLAAEMLNSPDKGEEESKAALALALAEEDLKTKGVGGLADMDLLKRSLGMVGIDLDKMITDQKNRKEGGMPFVAAGQAMIEASRAGYNVPQAIATAMASFTETQNKLNQVDPTLLSIGMSVFKSSIDAAKGTPLGDLQDVVFEDGTRIPFATKEEARLWTSIGLNPVPYETSKSGDLYTYYEDGNPVTRKFTPEQLTEWSAENPDAIIHKFGEGIDHTKELAWRNGDGSITRGTNKDYYRVVSGQPFENRPSLVNQNIREGVMVDPETGEETSTWITDDDVLQAMEDMAAGKQPKYKPKEDGQYLSFSDGTNSFVYTTGNRSSRDVTDIQKERTDAANEAIKTFYDEQQLDNAAVADVVDLGNKVFDIIDTIEAEGLPAGGLASRVNAAITGYLDGFGDLTSTYTGRNQDTGFAFSDDDGELETLDGKIVTRSRDEMFNAFKNKAGQFGELGFDFENTPWYKKVRQAGVEQELLERLVFDLGIKGAALQGQEGRALSDRDLMLFMRRMGGDARSARQFRSNIADALGSVLDSYENRSSMRANPIIFGAVGYLKDDQGVDTKVLDEQFFNPLALGGDSSPVVQTNEGRYKWKDQNVLDTTDFRSRLSKMRGKPSAMDSPNTAILQDEVYVDKSLENLSTIQNGRFAPSLSLSMPVPNKNVVFNQSTNKGMNAIMKSPLAQTIMSSEEVTIADILELYYKEMIPRMTLPDTQLSKPAKSKMADDFMKYFVIPTGQKAVFDELTNAYKEAAYSG